MSWITRQMNAMTTAYKAYRAYLDPDADVRGNYQSRAAQYRILWAYYQNSAFDQVSRAEWKQYIGDQRLWAGIRSIYNPTRRLVNFYAGQVYQGVLGVDGEKLPDGLSLAIPLTLGKDVPDDLRGAIAQLWLWSNWLSGNKRMVRYGSALGECLVEVCDETDREKVTLEVHWPGRVSDLELNPQGDVLRYALEYWSEERQRDGGMKRFKFRKVVDRETVQTFRDDEPFEYEGIQTGEHGYGFCPAVWVRHRDEGSDHGSPAIGGSLGKIDELNNIVSIAHWHMKRQAFAPQIIFTDSPVNFALSREAAADLPDEEREAVLQLLRAKQGGSTAQLAGNLSLSDSIEYARDLMAEIEHDHPELAMYKQLREMSTVTGPAASRLLGDVQALVSEASANYDQQSVKAFQMAVAIAGERVKRGDWKRRTRQQEAFKGFDLESYAAGRLDVGIEPRPLVPISQSERWAGETQRANALAGYVQAGVPVEVAMRLLGFSDDDVRAITKDSVEAMDRAQRLANADVPPSGVVGQ